MEDSQCCASSASLAQPLPHILATAVETARSLSFISYLSMALVENNQMIGVLKSQAQHTSELNLQMPHLHYEWKQTTEVVNSQMSEVMYRLVRPQTLDLKHGRRGWANLLD